MTFWDSQLFGAIIGAVAAMVVFAAGTAVERWKDKKAKLESYLVTLTFTRDEISFYIELLAQLSGELGRLAHGFQHAPHGPFIIPSYSLYPRLLENSKTELARARRNSDLVRQVSRTHFELSHIAERLEELKRDWSAGPSNLAFACRNIEGFKKLVDDDISGFQACVFALTTEADTTARELSNLDIMFP